MANPLDTNKAHERRQAVLAMTAHEIADTLAGIVELGLLEKTEASPAPDEVDLEFEFWREGTAFVETLESFGGFQTASNALDNRLDPNVCLAVAQRLAENVRADVRAYAPMFLTEAYDADDPTKVVELLERSLTDSSQRVRKEARESYFHLTNPTELPSDLFYRTIRAYAASLRMQS